MIVNHPAPHFGDEEPQSGTQHRLMPVLSLGGELLLPGIDYSIRADVRPISVKLIFSLLLRLVGAPCQSLKIPKQIGLQLLNECLSRFQIKVHPRPCQSGEIPVPCRVAVIVKRILILAFVAAF